MLTKRHPDSGTCGSRFGTGVLGTISFTESLRPPADHHHLDIDYEGPFPKIRALWFESCTNSQKKFRHYNTLGRPTAKSTVLSELFFDEYVPDSNHITFPRAETQVLAFRNPQAILGAPGEPPGRTEHPSARKKQLYIQTPDQPLLRPLC